MLFLKYMSICIKKAPILCSRKQQNELNFYSGEHNTLYEHMSFSQGFLALFSAYP